MSLVIDLDQVPDLTVVAKYKGENKEINVPDAHSAIVKKVAAEEVETITDQSVIIREVVGMPDLSDTAAMKLYKFMGKAIQDFMAVKNV